MGNLFCSWVILLVLHQWLTHHCYPMRVLSSHGLILARIVHHQHFWLARLMSSSERAACPHTASSSHRRQTLDTYLVAVQIDWPGETLHRALIDSHVSDDAPSHHHHGVLHARGTLHPIPPHRQVARHCNEVDSQMLDWSVFGVESHRPHPDTVHRP